MGGSCLEHMHTGYSKEKRTHKASCARVRVFFSANTVYMRHRNRIFRSFTRNDSFQKSTYMTLFVPHEARAHALGEGVDVHVVGFGDGGVFSTNEAHGRDGGVENIGLTGDVRYQRICGKMMYPCRRSRKRSLHTESMLSIHFEVERLITQKGTGK